MMIGSTFGIQNYYALFSSPVKGYEVNPATNLMYSAIANKAYMQSFAKRVQSSMSSYLSSMNSTVNDLKSAAKPLAAKDSSSSFNQKSVTTDSSFVSGTAAYNADAKEYTLNVSQLAAAQTNTGKTLVSTGKSFETGLNSFSIQVGDSKAKTISFTVNENDTNATSLGKMAKAINQAKTGVTASVISDSKAGTSHLRLVSDETGSDNSFSLTDGTGNAVGVSGIDSISAEAQDAEYTLDGKQYTSQQNTASIDEGKVRLSFSKAEGKDIKVRVGTDTAAIKEDIKDFVNSYNSVISFVNANTSDFSGAGRLREELDKLVSSKGYSLRNMGIASEADGTLSIDEERLDNALSSNLSSAKNTLSGYNGFAQKVVDKSNEVLNGPMKYSKPNESSISTSNFYSLLFNPPNTQNSYLSNMQNMYSGLIVDALL